MSCKVRTWLLISYYLIFISDIYILIKRPIDDIYFLIFLLVERGMDTQHVYRWCCKKRPHSVSCNKLEGGMGVFRGFSVN